VTQDVKNRRAATRRLAKEGVVILTDGRRVRTRLIDISDTGARLAAPDGLSDGARFVMEFEDKSQAPARVVWLRDGFAGAQFDVPLSAQGDLRAA
jgi:hypothetical protein